MNKMVREHVLSGENISRVTNMWGYGPLSSYHFHVEFERSREEAVHKTVFDTVFHHDDLRSQWRQLAATIDFRYTQGEKYTGTTPSGDKINNIPHFTIFTHHFATFDNLYTLKWKYSAHFLH